MYRMLVISICLVLFSVVMIGAQETGANGPAGPTAFTGPAAPAAPAAQAASAASPAPAAQVAPAAPATPAAAEAAGDPDAKLIGGMSILGNKEAPMSLFIVPWKTSELGAEANLTRTLNERRVAVDRDVFLRELAFYEVSASAKSPAPATAVSLLTKR